ncbi:MAG TPA: hypothetical protein VJ300_06305, partial [Thermoplasmata archaeon]|nr:hypothetical protein [Thermoplasmata archaeon]
MRPLGARALGLAVLLAATPFLLPTSQAASGGPDAYGYVWVDSRAPSPVVPYIWRDITSSGTRVALAADDCTFEIAMGFQFRFYGILVDQIHVCSDGFLTFSLQGFGLNSSIPDPAPPNDRVVALGMDLFPPTSGSAGVFVLPEPSTVPKRFTVTWNEVVTQYTSDRQTFQVILEQNSTSRDGRILIQYRTLTNIGFARIGIENRTGSSGLEYPYAPSNGLAVAFLPPSDAGLPPDTLTVTPTVLAPASTIQGARNVPMLQLDVATLSNEALVSGLIVQLSGVNAGPSDVPTASLWLDDGDGTFSPSNDFRLGIGVIQLAPTIAMFTLVPSVGVSMALPQRMYVAYDIAPGARPGNWIGARMAASSAVSVEFPDVVAAAGFPAETYIPNTQTRIDASIDTLVLLSATDRVPGNVAQWQTDVPLMSIQLGVASNIVDVAGLTLEIGGNATAAEVWRVKALEDVDRNGSYTPGIDVVLAVV